MENSQKPYLNPDVSGLKQQFSWEQYDILKRCSDKKNLTEWSQWRQKNPDEKILLEGAEFQDSWLRSANLQDAYLVKANLQGADLWEANLRDAFLMETRLQKADLSGACLQNADLWEANLQDAHLRQANLQKTVLWQAELQGAVLWRANLQDADLRETNLQGTDFSFAKLQDANFSRAVVDGKTLIWKCSVDHNTHFGGVGLGSARIDSGTKQLLEYNIRKTNWDEWYKEHRLLKLPVRWFWQLSNYGLSTWRVIVLFFLLAFFFAALYANLAYLWPPGVINDLYPEPDITHQDSWLHHIDYGLEVFFRPIYFSAVTMTTLGFGDMYARKGSWLGHVLLIVQVILGYVLLGALITRFAILFAAGGPAGTFTKRETKETPSDK